jgi:hypothetical protein
MAAPPASRMPPTNSLLLSTASTIPAVYTLPSTTSPHPSSN